jgi:hypothetical protein
MLEQYHKKVSPKKTNLLTDAALRRWRPVQPIKTCFRCGRYFLRTGRAFTVRCVEGRTVKFSICRACAAATAFAAAISSPEVQAA